MEDEVLYGPLSPESSPFAANPATLLGRSGLLLGALWFNSTTRTFFHTAHPQLNGLSLFASAPLPHVALCTARILQTFLIPDGLLATIATAVVSSGRTLAIKTPGDAAAATPPLRYRWMEKEYLGAAHGFEIPVPLLSNMYVQVYWHSVCAAALCRCHGPGLRVFAECAADSRLGAVPGPCIVRFVSCIHVFRVSGRSEWTVAHGVQRHKETGASVTLVRPALHPLHDFILKQVSRVRIMPLSFV